MQEFCSHLDLLAELGRTTCTVRELAADLDLAIHPANSVVITFDDGYADNLPACEELQRRGMRATVFMVSGSVGREPAWPADGRPAGRLLNNSELRSLGLAGIEIGSHTVTHCRLPELDASRLQAELADSKATLEDAVGSPIDTLAYPYGAWDERSEQLVKAVGYRAACTTRSGWATRDRDPFRLRRLSVFNTDSTGVLARKLAFADNDASWGRLAGYYWSRATRRLAD